MAAGIAPCTPLTPPLPDGSGRSFDPKWRTESVLSLARAIEADHALDRLPVLADALEEAGCDDAVLLRHCRECDRHDPECWAVGHVLASDVTPLLTLWNAPTPLAVELDNPVIRGLMPDRVSADPSELLSVEHLLVAVAVILAIAVFVAATL